MVLSPACHSIRDTLGYRSETSEIIDVVAIWDDACLLTDSFLTLRVFVNWFAFPRLICAFAHTVKRGLLAYYGSSAGAVFLLSCYLSAEIDLEILEEGLQGSNGYGCIFMLIPESNS